ncbi:hypothetical protein H0O02_00700 [Candidatus Micrarchaeota archaeon]|nr:hypothetical protein [Candidatus Micrarchaeota archaeon]
MAAKASNTGKYGEWAFLLGVILALVIGLFSSQLGIASAYLMAVLAILGLVVGFLNVTEKEVNTFLIAAIALLAIPNVLVPLNTSLALVPQVGATVAIWLSGIFSAIGVFVAPAALIVALKAIYSLAKPD